jgi:hypothetical protein
MLDNNGDPTVLELTFEKTPIKIGENCVLPNSLDMKNNPKIPDIELKFK